MEKTKVEKPVEMPEGKLCGYCCGDCVFMDLNSTDKYGQAWCGKYKKYYSPSEGISGCSYFVAK